MMGELLYPAYLEKRLASILEWKNLTIQNVYGAEAYKLEDMLCLLYTSRRRLRTLSAF